MGEENRGSSGSGTAMVVIGIIAVVMAMGCCGVFAIFGAGSYLFVREAQDAQMRESMDALARPPAPMEMQPPRMPAEDPFVPPPESIPSTPTPLDSKIDLESPPGGSTDDEK